MRSIILFSSFLIQSLHSIFWKQNWCRVWSQILEPLKWVSISPNLLYRHSLVCCNSYQFIASESQSRLLDFCKLVVQILWQVKKKKILCQSRHFFSVIEVLMVQKNYYSCSYTDTSTYHSNYILMKIYVCKLSSTFPFLRY